MSRRRHTIAVALLKLVCTAPAVADDDNTAPQFPRAITGRVTDSDGQPLAGALVEWGYFSDGAEDRESVETDAEGRYRLETSNVGRDFRLGVSHTGFAPFFADAIVPGPSDEPTSIDARLSPGISITLVITDAVGNPLSELAVTPRTPSNGYDSLFDGHGYYPPPVPPTPLPGRHRTVTTDENGRVTLVDLPVQPRGLRAIRNGIPDPRYWLSLALHRGEEPVHAFQLTDAQAIDKGTVNVTVPHYRTSDSAEHQNAMIRGRVVDGRTGEAITDYHVTLPQRPEPIEVDSSDGRFTIGSMVRNRRYVTRIFATGYAVQYASIPADWPSMAVEQTIRLRRHPSLEGRLVDATSGKPLIDVQIVAGFALKRLHNSLDWSALNDYADGGYGLSNVIRVVTDDDGRFTVPEDPRLRVTLVILTDDYERRIVPHWKRPDPDRDGVIPIALQPSASITAIVLPETQLGQQATAVAISFTSDDGFEHRYHPTPPDESGRLRFESLASGEYELSLYADLRDGPYRCYTRSFTLMPGEDRELVLGELPGTLRVHGVVDPFAIVRIWPQFPTEIRNLVVYADIDGRFELQDLLPGEYKVSFHILHASSGRINCCRWQTIELTEDTELMLPNPQLGPGDR